MTVAARLGRILIAAGMAGGFACANPPAKKGPAQRPIIILLTVRRESGGLDRPSAQIDGTTGRISVEVSFNRSPRWQPGGNYVAGWYSPGVYVSRYVPAKRRFTLLGPASRVFAGKGVSYELGTGALWPMLAWSPDGRSLLLDEGDLVAIDLRRGIRKTIVSVAQLPLARDDDEIRGMDWSPDGRWIAYSIPGRDAAPKGPFDTEEPRKVDRGRHCDVWLLRPDGTRRHRLGHGSRPRFSPDGRQLLVLDRLSDRFGTCLRTYNLRSARPVARLLIKDARAGCYAAEPDRLAVMLARGDLVIVDGKGRERRRVTSLRAIVSAAAERDAVPGEGEALELRRADMDW